MTPVRLFTTCPVLAATPPEDYLNRVAQVARWSEQYGATGILVYSDNSLLDPWLLSQIILSSTARLAPLVAVQPVYMHPYTVAKMVVSFAHLYGRQIYLNMVAGGFANDLAALNDQTPHDRRYARLTEYTNIIRRLLLEAAPLTFAGEFYSVRNLKMKPALAKTLFPGIFVSSSSAAGLQAAKDCQAAAIHYPKPPNECAQEALPEELECGVRVGIIARPDAAEAWQIAEQRFPADRQGELMHQLANQASDSVWHKTLSEMAQQPGDYQTYWLRPFRTYKTFCPYLVGSYEEVAAALATYMGAGFEIFILDIPPSEAELFHIAEVFKLACKSGVYEQQSAITGNLPSGAAA
ncbi:MAG TPA: LLM class flavin-dependent oxidoreductase [Terriglobales bacterium]